MLNETSRLRGMGFAAHWLRAKDKAPIKPDWANLPVASIDELKKTYRRGYNLGVRIGEPSRVFGHYLHLIDLDIRDESRLEEAVEILKRYIPEFETLPRVKSGSGGSSAHYYFLSDEAFPSKKLAHCGEFDMVWDDKKGREVKKWKWEIEFFGTGKQAVLPPSIHPDTGNPYAWEIEFDAEEMTLGLLPIVTAERIREWGVVRTEATGNGEIKPPLGLSVDEVRDILDDLPSETYCEDREGWLQLGMALHHEFDGAQEGFDLWTEYSRLSEKFDSKDQKRVWKSFRGKANPVRMATMVVAARNARLEREFEELDEDFDDFGDRNEDSRGENAESGDENLIGAPPSGQETAEAEDTKWMGKLDLTEDGIKNTLHNITLIVANDPRTKGLAQLNEFSLEICQRKQPGKKRGRRTKQLKGSPWTVEDVINGNMWTETRDNSIRDMFEAPKRHGGWGIKVSDRDLRSAIDLTAANHAYHPVREYHNSLEWDGTPRLDRTFIDYLGAPDTPYHRDTARMMMIAAVTRIFEPGHKFDFAVILEGAQGKRKSTFIRTLGCDRVLPPYN